MMKTLIRNVTTLLMTLVSHLWGQTSFDSLYSQILNSLGSGQKQSVHEASKKEPPSGNTAELHKQLKKSPASLSTPKLDDAEIQKKLDEIKTRALEDHIKKLEMLRIKQN